MGELEKAVETLACGSCSHSISRSPTLQWWRSGESARLPPMCPGFDSRTRRHMWIEFVVGSLLCSERFFSGYCCFPLSIKTNISKFQFDSGVHGHFWTSSCELLGAPWVNKLHLHFTRREIVFYFLNIGVTCQWNYIKSMAPIKHASFFSFNSQKLGVKKLAAVVILALSTRIRIFLNLQLFVSGYCYCPHVSG